MQIEHVAIAVGDLGSVLPAYRALLDREEAGREVVESEGVEVVFFEVGETRIELLKPIADESPVARFLDRHGPGLHHITFEVADLDAALRRCREAGLETVGEAPRPGAGGRQVAFLHPATTGGVLIELSGPPPEAR